ncbi:MAG TPA: hypothetical protein VIK13_01470 [Candidatus Limnocylindrales bacterium]
MHVNRGLLGWGVFFITLGCVPLAVRAGYLDPAVVARAWELWPLILVGIGLGLIFQRTKVAVVGGLVVAVTCGLMGGALLAGAVPSAGGISACGFGGSGGNGSAFPDQAGSFGAQARADLEFNCGELAVTSADGSAWTVVGTADGGRPPEILASSQSLRVRSPSHDGFNAGIAGSRWNIKLPRQVSLALRLSVNAGSARAGLAAMRVPELSVSVNAGDATVDASGLIETGSLSASVNAGSLAISLPVPAPTLRGTLSVNAGSIDVCVPDGVGLVIHTGQQALGSDNFADRGLVRAGDTWTRPGSSTPTPLIELDTDANLGSITLNPEAGCG